MSMQNNQANTTETNTTSATTTTANATAAASASAMTAAAETEELTPAELIELNQSRAATYALLSRLFREEADEALIDELHGQLYKVSTGNTNIDEGHRLLATALSGIWDNTITELAADYMRTFFGHGYSGHSAAYPFESIYAEEHRLLMNSARDEVLAIYRAAGIDKTESWKEGEDHIALELEFMGILAKRTAEAISAGKADEARSLLKTQYGFMQDHLGAWAPLLADGMRGYAKTDFYQGLSYLLDGFIETDTAFLEEANQAQ